MKKLGFVFFSFLLICLVSSTASAAIIDLAEYSINIDGTEDYMGTAPAGFDDMTGLGTWAVTLSGAGDHSVLGYFDHEIDEDINTFYNEFGAAVGTPGTGQSWEIDEPGWSFGDIYTNFQAGTLDNSNGVPSGSPDDVSMAMGWDFNLAAGETAYINFILSETMPTNSGFYLVQTDFDSQANVYFSSNLTIRDGGNPPPVPEPSTIVLVLSGLGLAAAARFRKSA